MNRHNPEVGIPRAVLLAASSRESPDAPALWEHGAADRRASPASGVAEAVVARKSVDEEVRHGKVSLESARKAAVPGFGVLRRGRNWPSWGQLGILGLDNWL
jgi:hypothetical protein